jgi:hypothetical protein
MKRTSIITLFLILFFNFNSCSNEQLELKKMSSDDAEILDDSEIEDKIIFGEVYGSCGGDCRNLFLLTEKNIYEDSNTDAYDEINNWANTTFKKQPLSNEKFELTKILLAIPESLFELENTFSEQQIVADFDFFISIKRGNKTQLLIFDRPHGKADNESKLYLEKLIEISKELRHY